VKRFTQLRGFYNVSLAQLRQIRDRRRELLSSREPAEQRQGVGLSRPVCTGPTVLCGF
jgi:hypothetical protein